MIKLQKVSSISKMKVRVMFKILYCAIAVLFCACSNLNSPHFSKDFIEERRMQLTRKVELVTGDKTRLVVFCTYISQLDSDKYPDGEYFFIEVDFIDKKLGIKDLQFSLLDEKPLEITTIPYSDKDFFQHTHWNEGYLLRFDSVPRTEFAVLSLDLKVKGYSEILKFNYGFKVENIL